MDEQHMYIHLLAGGLAGSTGTVLTCPLEVIKTRLQSSSSSLQRLAVRPQLQAASHTHTQLLNNNCLNLSSVTKSRYKLSPNSIVLFKNTNCLGARPVTDCMSNGVNFVNSINTSSKSLQPRLGLNIYLHLRFILENEGYRALFKGLAPTLVGVAPYRAIYFYSYANSKKAFADRLGHDSPLLHAFSAFVAGN